MEDFAPAAAAPAANDDDDGVGTLFDAAGVIAFAVVGDKLKGFPD